MRRAGETADLSRSMENRGKTAPGSKKKRTAKPGRALQKTKRTAKAGRALPTLLASASGMAIAKEQRISYLTYPGAFSGAGITVTVSRGISPHSAAGFAGNRHAVLLSTCRRKVYHTSRQNARDFFSSPRSSPRFPALRRENDSGLPLFHPRAAVTD